MAVELGCSLVDGVHYDSPRTELVAASDASSQGIDEEVASETATLLSLIDCQPGQEHDGHGVGHSSSQPRRCACMNDRAHRERVVADHAVASAQHVGRGCPCGAGNLRRALQPAVEICDTGLERLDTVGGGEPLDRPESVCAHREGIGLGSAA